MFIAVGFIYYRIVGELDESLVISRQRILVFTLCGSLSMMARLTWSILQLLRVGEDEKDRSLLHNTVSFPLQYVLLLFISEGVPIIYLTVVMGMASAAAKYRNS